MSYMNPMNIDNQDGTTKSQTTTTYLSPMTDTASLFNIQAGGWSSIINSNLKGDILTLTIDLGAYRAVEKMADDKKGTREQSNKLKQSVSQIVQQSTDAYQQELIEYKKNLEQWRITQGHKPSKPHPPQKPENFDLYLITPAERRAYIKSYFLYEYLIQDLKMSGEFTCDDFNKALKYMDKEAVAVDKGGRKIRKILGKIDRVLYTDTTDYVESVKDKTYNDVYEYIFHPIRFTKDPNSRTQELHYRVSGLLRLNIYLKRQFLLNPAKILSLDEIIELYSSDKNYRTSKGANITRSTLTTRTKPCNELIYNKMSFNFAVYQPDYSLLHLDGLPQSALFKSLVPNELKKWKNHHHEQSKIRKSSRQFHSFHYLPKVYREYITYNGSPLVEAMDVTGCYYVLISKALEIALDVNHEELLRFKSLVRDNDIYEEVGRHVLIASTTPSDDGINYREEELLSFYSDTGDNGKAMRNIIKDDMQKFRNTLDINQAYRKFPMLSLYFMKVFPSITKWLFDYPTHYDVEKKRQVKNLQDDMSRIETLLISKVCFKLVDMGLTPFTLHDAIYLSRDELSKLEDGAVDKLFWEAYDNTTPKEIMSCFDLDAKTIKKIEKKLEKQTKKSTKHSSLLDLFLK